MCDNMDTRTSRLGALKRVEPLTEFSSEGETRA
jgi:hypothetical protein